MLARRRVRGVGQPDPAVRAVPAAARGLLPAAGATFVATWALGGFYQAFGPSVAADQLGTTNTLIAAVVSASLMAPSAIGAPLAGRTTPAGAQRIGIVVFFGAVVAILVALHGGSVVPFIAASAVAGAAIRGLIAGQLSRSLSLFDIALGYGALAALACVITLVAAGEPRPRAPDEQPATA